jgi:hypothetical protein
MSAVGVVIIDRVPFGKPQSAEDVAKRQAQCIEAAIQTTGAAKFSPVGCSAIRSLIRAARISFSMAHTKLSIPSIYALSLL